MTSFPSGRPLTAEDMYDVPEDARYELVRGEVRRRSWADFQSARVSARLGFAIGQFVDDACLGVVLAAYAGFVLQRNPDTVLAPCGAFIRTERIPPRELRDRFPEFAPDLVIEVRCMFDEPEPMAEKIDLWLRHGTRLLWIAYPDDQSVVVRAPDRAARVLRAAASDILDGGDVLPGFSLPLADIFV